MVCFGSINNAEQFSFRFVIEKWHFCGFIIWSADPQLNLKDYIYSAACEV